MFIVNEHYVIKMIEFEGAQPTVKEYHNCKVVELQLPLVRFMQGSHEFIVNPASYVFVSATWQKRA